MTQFSGIVMRYTLWNRNILERKTLQVCLRQVLLYVKLTICPVMYIPSVPLTPQNQAYVERQRESFLQGKRPPDFPQGRGEDQFIGVGRVDDISTPMGRRAMGFPISVA